MTMLVSSCDRYAACWAPFCHGLQTYWPEHPARLLFITNYLDAPCGESLKLGKDRGWATNLLAALEKVTTDFVLYIQEDYWIRRRVPDKNIKEYLAYLEEGLADAIRLYPKPLPNRAWRFDNRLGFMHPNSAYRTSLQMTLWRKKTLVNLLSPEETASQFELRGTMRSRHLAERLMSVTGKQFGIDYVFTAVIDGYWSVEALAYAREEGLQVDWKSLPQKPLWRRGLDWLRFSRLGMNKKIMH